MRATELASAESMEERDLVEFQSDRQTDKGPATGAVLVRDGGVVAIQFNSDIEWFEVKNIIVLELVTRPNGVRLWLLE
jgi:hypothetical protein